MAIATDHDLDVHAVAPPNLQCRPSFWKTVIESVSFATSSTLLEILSSDHPAGNSLLVATFAPGRCSSSIRSCRSHGIVNLFGR